MEKDIFNVRLKWLITGKYLVVISPILLKYIQSFFNFYGNIYRHLF